MKTYLITIIALVLFLGSVPRQVFAKGSIETRKALYDAYLSSLQRLWEKGVVQEQRKFDSNPSDQNRFDLAYAQFGLLSYTLKNKDEDLFDDYVDETVEHLEHLVENDHRAADAKALLSSIYGLKISYSSWKGMFLGPRSARLIEEATKTDENSAIAWKMHGRSKQFTPKSFGGDNEAAIKSYEKAIELWETKNLIQDNWFYLDTHAWLGLAYEKKGDVEKAISCYEKALELEPDFNWVKSSLLPKARNK